MGKNQRMKTMKDRREKTDRRFSGKEHDRADKCNRRNSPDRRLNNIQVEWIPFNHVHLHPQTRELFSRTKNSD
jgi:hypothetical protein